MVSKNVPEDFGHLLQGSHAFQTKAEELIVKQGNHLEKGDRHNFESKLKVAEENEVFDLSKVTYSFKVESIAKVFGPEDAEQKDFFHLPELSSICTNDLPDLEDVESTVAFSTNQFSKIKLLTYAKDEDGY